MSRARDATIASAPAPGARWVRRWDDTEDEAFFATRLATRAQVEKAAIAAGLLSSGVPLSVNGLGPTGSEGVDSGEGYVAACAG